jgi:hypothetical protein
MRTSAIAVVSFGIVLLAGCQGPDVGQSCSISAESINSLLSVPADFFESNPANGCDNLVCIRSPDRAATGKVKSNPYCSKACVSDDDCFNDETGLVCRPVTIDPNQIQTFSAEVQEQYRRMLGELQFSSYCAAPLPLN